jgi:hypothetical protein
MPKKDTGGSTGKDWQVGDLALSLVDGTHSNLVKGRVYEVQDLVYPCPDHPDPKKRWRWAGGDLEGVGLILPGIKWNRPQRIGACHHGYFIKVTPEKLTEEDKEVVYLYNSKPARKKEKVS